MEQSKCLKFLGVLLDENLCWKEHIKYEKKVKSKIAKNIGLLYKAKSYIDKHLLLSLYHSYMHSYFNYGNIARRNSAKTNLKKYIQSTGTCFGVVYNKNILSHTREFFKECKVLNAYQVNI